MSGGGMRRETARFWDGLHAPLPLLRSTARLEGHVEFKLPSNASAWTPDGFTWKPGKTPSDLSWFGFMMLVSGGPEARTSLARALDRAKIGNRMCFGGKSVRQSAFVQLKAETISAGFHVVGDLTDSDRVRYKSLL